jgi:two-component system repressor protein LuxO
LNAFKDKSKMAEKILIVDDEANNLDVLNNCLEDAGFEVRVNNNGQAALKQASYIKPDLILLDVKMPDMDGFETCRRLKQKSVTQDIPIIFLTIADNPTDKIKGFEMGAVDYITKPFQTVEVVARVKKHLFISQLQKQLQAKNAQLQDYIYHLESLDALRKAIDEAENVTDMMEQAMQVTLSVFNCDRAWLLYSCDPKAPSWRVPIEATTSEYPGAHQLNIDIPMEPTKAQMMTDALSASEPMVFGPESEHPVPAMIAEQFSVQSQLCFAISPKIGKPWLFGLHQCSHARVWTDNEITLFRQFGQQIAVSLGLSISVTELQKLEGQFGRERYHQLVGACKPMQKIYQIIDQIADSDVAVLLTGESGTGKELCAQAIHQQSHRADKPLVICNCAAIPENLIESHLFGHVKGAFTGADTHQKGLVSGADGGTLFLDEIGEIPFLMQSTLLRFLQTKTFSKVGNPKVESMDVRLICATNCDLAADVAAGRFRQDLYYRINTVEIELPPLRERGTDILQLATFFLHQFAKKEHQAFQRFNPEAQRMLLDYRWPGNVRELQNTIHHVVLLNTGQVVTAKMLSAKIDTNPSDKNAPLPNVPVNSPMVALTSGDTFRPLKDIEKDVIKAALTFCQGHVVNAANLLKISHGTLYNKIKKSEMEFDLNGFKNREA